MAHKEVLRDHIRRGKVLVPPITEFFGAMQDVSWVRTVMPELLWIALIQDCFGHRDGVELLTRTARAARTAAPSSPSPIFGAVGAFEVINSAQQEKICIALASTGDLSGIQKALFPLVALYPECPMRFLFSSTFAEADTLEYYLHYLKGLVADLYDKSARDTMMVQASFIWLAIDSGTLQVANDGVGLANFSEIENYPDTDQSIRVGSSIRAAMSVFFGADQHAPSSNWPTYFWSRGIEIDVCT